MTGWTKFGSYRQVRCNRNFVAADLGIGRRSDERNFFSSGKKMQVRLITMERDNEPIFEKNSRSGNDDAQKQHNGPTVTRKAAHNLFIQMYFCTLTPT